MALFVALGGASYAAISLPQGGVKSRHIDRGAVKGDHIATGAIGKRAIRKAAVGSHEIRNRSLRVADFQAGALQAGDVTVRSAHTGIAPNSDGSVTASCRDGEVAVTGGYLVPPGPGLEVWDSWPGTLSGTPTAWTVAVRNGSSAEIDAVAVVLCRS